jgi:NAD(P)-dependent dehydrogenase (short-subunit alcohol dehydrogenase family)
MTLNAHATEQRTAGPLKGKTAFITGGAGGFGLASALVLVRDGAAVTLMGRSVESLTKAKSRIERDVPDARVTIHAGDSNRGIDVRHAVQATVELYGSLDIVVATVGSTVAGMLEQQTTDDFMEGVALSLRPAHVAISECAPLMKNGGAFAFISSTAAIMPFMGLSAYCAGKAALDQLVRCAANELASRRLRFNAVRPGLVRTGATVDIFASKSVMDSFLERVPLGRTGEPEEVAAAIRYLVGPESQWTTGQSFAVDGGNEMRGAPLPIKQSNH